jgi:DNA-binding transcriptional LysR family regulator
MNKITQHLLRFDMISIRLLVDCVQHGSLSAAAELAHLALPAASRRMKELEQAVDETLFERQGRRLHPTRAGRVFYRHGVEVLQTLEQLGVELTNMRFGVVTKVRLCASTASISQFLAPMLRQYAHAFPRVRIDLEEQVSEGVVRSLREGRADVGIFVEGVETHGLDCQAFEQDELVLVLPPEHRLVGSGPLPFADTLDEDWISFTEGTALLLQLQQAAHAAGRVLRLRMQARSFDTVCHLVAAGMGIAMLPRAAAPIARVMNLHCRPLTDAWTARRIVIATRSGKNDPEAASLVDFIVYGSQKSKLREKKQ